MLPCVQQTAHSQGPVSTGDKTRMECGLTEPSESPATATAPGFISHQAQNKKGTHLSGAHRQGLAWSWDSQGLLPQCLQFAPILLPELLCPLSCVYGFWLAGHSSLHHLPTAEGQRSSALALGKFLRSRHSSRQAQAGGTLLIKSGGSDLRPPKGQKGPGCVPHSAYTQMSERGLSILLWPQPSSLPELKV